MDLSQQTKPYPRYLYHRDFNEPKIVNSKVEEVELGTKGWTTARLFKEYPKYVGDKIVRSKEEEERLLESQADPVSIPAESIDVSIENVPPTSMFIGLEDPEVVKETQAEGEDTVVVEKPKRGRPKK